MSTTKKTNLFTFLKSSFVLQRADFWQVPLTVLVVYAIMQALMLVIYAFTREKVVLSLGLPTLFALVCAVLMNVLQASSRFASEFRLGLHMSGTRRQMLLSGTVLSLANAAEILLLAAGLQALWTAVFGGTAEEGNVLAALPLWGWAACLYLPVAMGVLAGSILLRFGRIGFWVLYGMFMLSCFGPQLFGKQTEVLSLGQLDQILAALPWILPWAAVGLAAAGAALLWRVPVGE